MSSIDIETLLREISEDSPCGENLEYDPRYIDLGNRIVGTPEDPFTHQPYQPPKWTDIRRDTLELLGQTRDLRLILFLIRALSQLEGVAGLEQGLTLLESALDQYWETIHPQLDPDDDNDPVFRVNLLQELCDFELSLRPISLIPLIESRAIGRFSGRDFLIALDRIPLPAGAGKPDLSSIKAVLRESDPQQLQVLSQSLVSCQQRIVNIENSVTEKVGVSQAPNLQSVRSLLRDISHGLAEVIDSAGLSLGDETEGEATADAEDDPAGSSAGKSAKPASGDGAIESRKDVIRTLEKLCRYYAEHEPSSPVPILLERARKLVDMNFIDLIKNLAPDGLGQIETIQGPGDEDED